MATLTPEETLNYLYSLIPKGIKLGLKNISTVLNGLGNPQLNTPTIHIAGTNGKGFVNQFSAMQATKSDCTHLHI